jgi:hypothetical protein
MNPSLTLDLGIYENGFGIKKSSKARDLIKKEKLL